MWPVVHQLGWMDAEQAAGDGQLSQVRTHNRDRGSALASASHWCLQYHRIVLPR